MCIRDRPQIVTVSAPSADAAAVQMAAVQNGLAGPSMMPQGLSLIHILHENYKQRVIKAKDIDSTVTGRSHGHPVRGLRNQMTREYIKLEQEGRSFEELEYLTLGALRKAVMEGDVNGGTVMAGQIAGMISKEQTCKEMIEEIMAQAGKLMHWN